MPVNTTTANFDTMSGSHFPSANFGWWRRIALRDDPDATQYAYLYWGGMPPPEGSVISATLRLMLRASHWNDHDHTITAKRITQSWKESKLTWNNAPSVTSSNSASVVVNTLVTAPGAEVELDVSNLVSDAMAAGAWYGIRLELSTADTDPHFIWSSDAGLLERRPELEVEWSRAPRPPVDLSPSGGRSVSLSHPTVTWNFRDREGDEQAELQVQISTGSATDADGSLSSVEFDSGWVVSSDEQLDLSDTSYAGVSTGATRYWIVRTRDVHGLVSQWSDPAEFSRAGKPTLTIDSIPDGGVVEETTPPIDTTLSNAQEAISYRLWEQQPDGTFEMVWHEWRHAAPADAGVTHSFTIPPGHIRFTGRTYSIRVLSWDTEDREDTPGDPAYVRETADFTFERSDPSPVTSLNVENDEPGVRLTFNRGAGVAAPDYFALVVDGQRVEDRLDPTDFDQGGDPIVYELVYYGATRQVPHTLEVEAVVDDVGTLKHSQGNATVDYEPPVTGIWLVDQTEDVLATFAPDDLPRRVRMLGEATPNLTVGESGSTFHVVGRRDPVRVLDAIRGLEGRVSGTIREDDPASPGGAASIENLKWAKRWPGLAGRRWRLIYGSENLPVELGEASWTPTSQRDLWEYAVSIDVTQVAEFT